MPGEVHPPLCERELLRRLTPWPRAPPGCEACVGGVAFGLEGDVVLLVRVRIRVRVRVRVRARARVRVRIRVSLRMIRLKSL